MARRTLEERLAIERQRKAQLDQRIRKLEAQAAKTERAKDTRRKVLLGAFVLSEIAKGGPSAKNLRQLLRERLSDHLSRDTDRALLADLLQPSDDDRER